MDVSNNKTLACTIIMNELPIVNHKCTESTITIYTALALKQYDSHKYLIAKKKTIGLKKENSFIANEFAIVRLFHCTGSWNNTYTKYVKYFLVRTAGEQEVEINDLAKQQIHTKAKIKNLIPLEPISMEKHAEVEAFLVNKYNCKMSTYDDVVLLYHYFTEKCRTVDSVITQVTDVEMKIVELQNLIMEKERELQALREELQKLYQQYLK